MIKSFFKHYLELPPKTRNIVCLGGGIGTSQILKGIKGEGVKLTAIVSMADDGGSAGRLRRAFSVLPPGDLVNCLSALSEEESIIKDLLLYRFIGENDKKDTELGGHKLGNLIFVALSDIYKGDSAKALEEFSKIISSQGQVLPATLDNVTIWGKTKTGKKVYGETTIDLGKYNGAKALKEVHLDPENIKAYKKTLNAIKGASLIIVGPGDLFSNLLPVLIVEDIKKELISSSAHKIFIVNIANKPFETVGFRVSDYLKTLKDHLGQDIFDTILVNTNQKLAIERDLNYKYVTFDKQNLENYAACIRPGDFVNKAYPIYHDPQKVAQAIESVIK